MKYTIAVIAALTLVLGVSALVLLKGEDAPASATATQASVPTPEAPKKSDDDALKGFKIP